MAALAALGERGATGEVGAADQTGVRDEMPLLADALLAVALAVAAQIDLRFNLDNSTHYGSDFATSVVVTIATLALAWRRRWPFVTLCVVAAAVGLPELFGTLTFTLWGHFVPLLVAAYTAARLCDRRLAVASVVIVVAAIAVVLMGNPATGSAGNIPFALVPAGGLMIAGRVLRRRDLRSRDLAERARRLEADREADVAAALVAERARIARELHDVVAHCVSVMVVQAGVSEALLDDPPESVREPLRAVQETGRQAIVELTRMLGLLRAGSPDVGQESGHDRAPQPGVAQLPELLSGFTASGLTVELATVGEVRPVPPGVDLTIYRIAQEALTNALKHAGRDVNAHIELRYEPRAVHIEVTDDGVGATTSDGSGHRSPRGHGLVGMAERASVFGGSIEVGDAPKGGFRVFVSLPVEST